MPSTEIRNVVTIASILVDSEILPKSDASKITATAANQNITVGNYLTANKLVHPQVVRAAILCQLLLHRKLLKYSTALSAVQLTEKYKCKLELALSSLRWNQRYFENLFQLTEIIRKAELIPLKDLELVYEICVRDESSLLSVLMARDLISDLLADRVLTLHKRVTTQELSLNQAAARLKEAALHASDTVSDTTDRPVIYMGELLLAANLVTAEQLIAAIEIGRAENVPFGLVLARNAVLQESLLEQTAIVQIQINSNFCTVTEGVQKLVSFSEKLHQ